MFGVFLRLLDFGDLAKNCGHCLACVTAPKLVTAPLSSRSGGLLPQSSP